MPRPPHAITLAALLAATLLGVTACGSDGSVSPSAEAQDLAQAGLLQSYTATYALTKSDGAPSGTLTVWRTPGSLRLDVNTASGVATSITTPAGTVACQKEATGGGTTCLTVAGPAKRPPANFDPELRKVFGDVLRVLATGEEGLQVAEVERPSPAARPSASASASSHPVATPSGVGEVRCFQVSGPAESVVSNGTYCLDTDGVPVELVFASGSATLTAFTPGPPAASTFTPPVKPTPLPTAS